MLEIFEFHHIGVATNDIKKTASYYETAGYCLSSIIFDPIQNVNIAFLYKDNMPTVELLEPVDDKSPVYKIVKTSGVTPYHCCYKVDDISYAIKNLREKRFIPLSNPVPAVALENKRICFLYNREVGLIELLEK